MPVNEAASVVRLYQGPKMTISGTPDDHLWTNPEEKPPEGVTHLMAIYGAMIINGPRARTPRPGPVCPAYPITLSYCNTRPTGSSIGGTSGSSRYCSRLISIVREIAASGRSCGSMPNGSSISSPISSRPKKA
jgi:hypothetical protein